MGEVNFPASSLYSREAEQAVIGAVFLDSGVHAIAEEQGVVADSFYEPQHQKIWDVICRLRLKGQYSDPVTVATELGGDDQLEYLAVLAANTPSSANVSSYAYIVVERARRRVWFNQLQLARDLFLDPQVQDPIKEADRIVSALDSFTGKSVGFQSLSEGVKHFLEVAQQRHDNPGIQGLRLGYKHVDHRVQGLQPGNLIIVGGRPGMGKTAYGLNIMRQVALADKDQAHQVLSFSLEMSTLEWVQRMVAAQGHIRSGLLKSGKVFDIEQQLARLNGSCSALQQLDIQICDDPGLTIGEIVAMCRTRHRRKPVSLVMVDYVGLVESHNARQTRADHLGEVSRGLKRLAKELGCVVLGLQQLNRGVEQRASKRPVISDLRDSGAIEQDADVIQFLYRDEYYYPDSLEKGQVEVITAKLRDGEPGTDYLKWRGEYALMEEMDSTMERSRSKSAYQYGSD